MILLRQKEFTSKKTKNLRRNLFLEKSENSFEREQADRLLKEGKIDQREWNRMIKNVGKDRLGFESAEPYLIDMSAGRVNSNKPGMYATKGKSKLEKKLLREETKLRLGKYDSLDKTVEEIKKLKRTIELRDKAKKATPWVIGGTIVAGTTIAGVKAYKKKKAKKANHDSDNKK